ncbi:MAG: TetR/AcrR family transcriptional regulator [Myxococcales bacterium]
MAAPSSTRPPSAPIVPLVDPTAEQDHRTRLIHAMVAAATERGYADATIADVVRHAHVSKRTFYEHFPDKESCFLAAYLAVAAELLARIATASAQETGIEERIVAAARAYFAALEERPQLTRTFLSDIHAAGPKALELRRRIHQQFADTLRHLVDAERVHLPGVRPLSREMATAIVGGINELILLAFDEGRGERLHEVADAAIQLVFAVLKTLPEDANPRLPIPR